MLDRMGERYGLRVQTTPIGFKYIATKLVDEDVLVGGEESGGLAVKGHIHERDGLYIGLLIVEMMVRRRRRLSELVEELYDEFGQHHAARTDLSTTEQTKHAVLARLRADEVREVDGRQVRRLETLDGYKLRFDDRWLMFRASGTEPVLRIYSEAPSQREAEDLVLAGMRLVTETARGMAG
jgi:phosphomannomutase